jgi:cell wall-associated NlpC family hydrolase
VHEHTSHRRRRSSIGAGTAALSLGLCLCAGQLLSMMPANAATTVVTQAAAAKTTPGVRSSVSSSSIAYGASVKVTARFYNPSTGKSVTSGSVRLQAYRSGKWINWGATKALGSSGTVTMSAAPKVTGYFRAHYYGNGSYKANSGGKLRVTVRPKVSSASGARVLAEAKKHTGALYKFGAAGPSRFDCSGFTEYVFKKAAGKSLPHKANSQQHYGSAVSKGAAHVGDLIIFRSGSYGYHAAIYAGGGYMYDSPHTGARVGKHKMYGSNYVVRRLAA